MKKSLIIFVCLIYGCAIAQKINEKKKSLPLDVKPENVAYIDSIINNTENTPKITTDFFKVVTRATPNKKVYNLEERKSCTITITNFGTKEIYIPEWFEIGWAKKSELYVELYRHNGDKYDLYEQISKLTTTNVQYKSTIDRKVLFSKEGSKVCIKRNRIDLFKKIVDTGKYYAKIYINLSDFGYFKIIETDMFFEVVDDI